MKDKTFDFHGTKMNIKVLTSESDGKYTIIYAIHQPNRGPALHMHPKGSETYFIIEGDYEFLLDNKSMTVKQESQFQFLEEFLIDLLQAVLVVK